MITVQRVTSDHLGFRYLIGELDKDLVNRYRELQEKFNGFNRIESLNTVVVAFAGDTPAGCACFKRFDEQTIEIKRMFVAENQRGKGLALAILSELERWATELNYSRAILECGNKQPEAVALYTKLGYTPIEKFEPYTHIDESICMGKSLRSQVN